MSVEYTRIHHVYLVTVRYAIHATRTGLQVSDIHQLRYPVPSYLLRNI